MTVTELVEMMRAGRGLLTVAAAAPALGVSKRTAYRMARDGTLPTMSLDGHHQRVSVAELLRLLGHDPERLLATPPAHRTETVSCSSNVTVTTTLDAS